jgi:hypothetical protein
MTTVQEDQETNAIRAVVADAETLQSDADGFVQLLTEDVALVPQAGPGIPVSSLPLARDAALPAARKGLPPVRPQRACPARTRGTPFPRDSGTHAGRRA